MKTAGAAAVIALALVNIVEILWPGQDVMERTGDSLTLAAFIYVAYEYRRHVRHELRPELLGRTTCVDFYRTQLTRERNLAQQSRRYLLPFVPGVTLSLLGGVVGEGIPPAQRVAMAAAGITLFLGAAWVNAHSARRLQRKIDALDSL